MDGYVRVWRQLDECDALDDNEPVCRRWAWVDLIKLANWKDGRLRKRGIQFEVKRGQVAWSQDALAVRWRWSRGKVRRFIEQLKNDQMVVQQNNNVTTVLAIVNYEYYQGDGTANGTANGQQTVQQTDSKRTADSTIEKKEQERKEETRKERKEPPKPPKGEITVDEFFRRWNEFAAKRPRISTCRKLTDIRRRKIRERLADPGWFDDFREAIKSLPLGSGGWQPNLDWLVRNSHNIYVILEGGFDWRGRDDPGLQKAAQLRRSNAEAERVAAELDAKHARQRAKPRSIVQELDLGNGQKIVRSVS